MMPNLIRLDLSKNKISRLKGTGLEQLEKMYYFDISDNAIADVAELSVLYFLPSIRFLWLDGNTIRDYRSEY